MVKSFIHEKMKLFLEGNRKAGLITQVGFICCDTETVDWKCASPLLYSAGLVDFKNIVCSLDYTNQRVLFHILFDKADLNTENYIMTMRETNYAFVENQQNNPTCAWKFVVIGDTAENIYVLDLISIDFFPEGKGAVIKCTLEFED